MMVHSVLSNTVLIFPSAKTIGNMVDRAVEEYCLCHMKEESTKLSDTEQIIKGLPPHPTRPRQIPIDSKKTGESHCSRYCRSVSSRSDHCREAISSARYSMSETAFHNSLVSRCKSSRHSINPLFDERRHSSS